MSLNRHPLVLAAALALGSTLGSARASAADDKVACVEASERAQVLRDQGKLVQAREALLICARSSCPAVVQQDCSGWLSSVESSLPSVVFSASDPNGRDASDVRVSIDGVQVLAALDGRAVSIDPGAHALRFELAGAPPLSERVVIAEGEKNRALHVQFQLPPQHAAHMPVSAPTNTSSAPAQRRAPVQAWIAGGVGVLALGGFAVLGASGSSRLASLRSSCGTTHSCSDAQLGAVKTRYALADVSLGVGVVALALSTYWFLSGSRGEPPAVARGALSLQPASSGLGGTVHVAF